MLFRTALVCGLVVLASGGAGAQPRDPLLAAVTDAIRTDPQYGIFDDVEVCLEGTTAVLRGRVTAAGKKARLGDRAARVEGISRVRNDIAVLPASREDDELRQRIARSVYGHPAFWPHAARPNPPIHIVVERGHVTLTGRVETAAEAALARSLAGGHGELSLASRLAVGSRRPRP